jgi:hypothetical protein
LTTSTTTITITITIIVIAVIVIVIVIVIIIIITGSTTLHGSWPSSDFAINNFFWLTFQPCINPQKSSKIDVFLSGISPFADRSSF